MTTRLALVLSLLLGALWAPAAAAQPVDATGLANPARPDPVAVPRRDTAPAADPARRPGLSPEEAARRFAVCKDHYRQERFQIAADCFLEVYRLVPRRNALLNAAISYAELGDRIRAARYLVAAEKIAGEPASSLLDPREYAKLLALRRQVGRLLVVPRDARDVVTLNGQQYPAGEVDEIFLPGEVRVEIAAADGTTLRRTFQLGAGGEERWVLRTGDRPDRVPPPPGNGARPRPRRRLPLAAFASAAAVAVAATLALTATGVHTERLGDRYVASPGLDLRAGGLRWRAATNALLGVAVISGVTAAILAGFTEWRRRAPDRDAPRTTITPLLGPGLGGLSVEGRY